MQRSELSASTETSHIEDSSSYSTKNQSFHQSIEIPHAYKDTHMRIDHMIIVGKMDLGAMKIEKGVIGKEKWKIAKGRVILLFRIWFNSLKYVGFQLGYCGFFIPSLAFLLLAIVCLYVYSVCIGVWGLEILPCSKGVQKTLWIWNILWMGFVSGPNCPLHL